MRANEDALASELRRRHGVTTTKRLSALGITKRSVEGARSAAPTRAPSQRCAVECIVARHSRTSHGDGLCRDRWRGDVSDGWRSVAAPQDAPSARGPRVHRHRPTHRRAARSASASCQASSRRPHRPSCRWHRRDVAAANSSRRGGDARSRRSRVTHRARHRSWATSRCRRSDTWPPHAGRPGSARKRPTRRRSGSTRSGQSSGAIGLRATPRTSDATAGLSTTRSGASPRPVVGRSDPP